MSEFGHVKISRKAYKSDPFWLEHREFSRWEAWEWLIQAAAWRAYRKVTKRAGVLQIERGETPPLAERFLADAWGWSSKNRARRFIDELVKMGRLQIGKRTGDGPTYHLVNYDTYQGERTAERTGSGPETDRKRTKIEAVKAGEVPNDLSNERADAMAEMQKDANQHAATIEAGPKRKSFSAEVRGIVSGDNSVAWTNFATAERVPWPDRPALLRLAFAELEKESARTLHWALVHVVSQQKDPIKPRTAEEVQSRSKPKPGSEAAAVRSEMPRQFHAPTTGGLTLVGSTPPPPMVDFDAERVSRWETDNPELASRLRIGIAARIPRGLPPGGRLAKGWADDEFRKEVLERLRKEAAA